MTHNYENFKAWAVGLMKIELSTHIYIYSPFSLSSCSLQKKKKNDILFHQNKVYKYNLFLYTQQNKKKNAF